MRYASALWTLFGFRGWHEGDLASVEDEHLDAMLGAARKHEKEAEQEQAKMRAEAR